MLLGVVALLRMSSALIVCLYVSVLSLCASARIGCDVDPSLVPEQLTVCVGVYMLFMFVCSRMSAGINVEVYCLSVSLCVRMDPRWHHPFTCVVCGPSGSGKSVFVERLLKHRFVMWSGAPSRVVWSYGVSQPELESRWSGTVEFVSGLSEIESLSDCVLIIDDQMSETDVTVSNLFTKGSHHRNVSVVYIVQNLFGKNRFMRTISLNSHYLVLFKNPRDGSQASILGKQMYPNKVKYFSEAYKEATSRPHGYLLCDLHQETPDHLRLRTDIFPDDPFQIVYVES